MATALERHTDLSFPMIQAACQRRGGISPSAGPIVRADFATETGYPWPSTGEGMMRKILGVLAGVVVAGLTIFIVEAISHIVYPAPVGADMTDPAVVSAYMTTAPLGALMAVAFGWFLGAVVGGWVALTISHWSPAGWIIAGLIAAGGVFNATQIPAPLWMQIATVLAPALGGLVARRLPGWRRA